MSTSPSPRRRPKPSAVLVVAACLAVIPGAACVAPQPPANPLPSSPTSTSPPPAPPTISATTTTTIAPPSGGTSGFSTTPLGAWRLVGGPGLAVALAGGVAYIGGDFTAVTDGVTTLNRQHVVAVNETNGQPLGGFIADTNGSVDTLAVVGSHLYLGGSFTTVNGVARRNLARVDLTSGAVDPAFALDASGVVWDLWLNGTRLYVGGDFTALGGTARRRAAALDTTTGTLVAGFKPQVDRRVSSVAVSPDGSTVYLGGRMTTVNGQSVLNLAAVAASDGSLRPERFAGVEAPDPAASTSDVRDLGVSPDGASVFVGIGGLHFNVVGSWDAATGARRWWHGFDPADHLDGDVQGIVYDHGRIYFGFHGGYNGDTSKRLMVADATSGTLDTGFRPNINGIVGVADVATDGAALAAVGDFNAVNGATLGGVAFFPRLP